MKCRNISNLISSPQIEVRIIPRFSKKEPEQLSFYFLKDLGKVKQDWRLKPGPPTTEFLCRCMINFSTLRASLVTQMVKNPPAMRDTCVPSDPWAGKIAWRRACIPLLETEEFRGKGRGIVTGAGPCRNWLRAVRERLSPRDLEVRGQARLWGAGWQWSSGWGVQWERVGLLPGGSGRREGRREAGACVLPSSTQSSPLGHRPRH